VVEESDGDLMGDGVNIAARLQEVAKPGGICLSEQAYWQVKGRLDLKVNDLGPVPLKNIAEPMRAYLLEFGAPREARSPPPADQAKSAPKRRSSFASLAAAIAALLLLAVAGGWYILNGRAPKPVEAAHLSIVVLPFANLSGDAEQEYFADGITDDLTTDLSHLSNSFVIARGTAYTYKGKPLDAKQIGRELGVRYVLEGSVRRVGENITLNAQLISTETGAHVWADRFDGERSKLGQLQVEFVSRLANSLGVELVKAESLRAMHERPNNPDAVDLSMRGWAELYRGVASKTNDDAAIGLFERALAIDPHLVPAMVGLAYTLANRVNYLYSDDPKSDIAQAEDWAERAVRAEPDNSDAHMAKARVFETKRQYPQAFAEDEAAIAANPNNAEAHAFASFWKLYLGRAEDGFPGLETAFRLSPRDPGVPVWQQLVCVLHNFLAQWEQGIEWCEKARAGAPENVYMLVQLAAANAWTGHDKEAKEAVAQLQKVHPGFTVQTYAGIHYTDDPTFNAQRARIVEGLRKAGLPEGEKKTN
jgi:TolB-like protein